MGARGRLFISTGVLLTIGACATTQEPARLVDIRPARTQADPNAKPSDPLYQAAVSAIERRDYALALDALQAARARSPDDPRVWNAMGVVYDKLGRFDLSARYYAQAQELDPGSRVVSQNLAYSNVLQEKQAGEARALAAAAPQVSPSAATVAAVAPPAAAPPPPQVAKVVQPAGASRTVAQVTDSERAPRAASGAFARWAAPVLEAFDPRPDVPPPPAAAAPVALARVTRPAAPPQTVARPAQAEHARRFAAVTEPLARMAAPVIEALTPAAPTPRPALAPVQTMTLSATPRPVAGPAPRVQLATRAATTAPIRVAAPTGRVTLARASTTSLLGRPLMVVNASGRRGGAEPMRLQLASRGWTAPVSVVRPGAVQATSTIRYASRNVVVARALARTLPYRVRLESCGSSCRGVTLFVGADALRWRGGPTRMRTPAVYRGRA